MSLGIDEVALARQEEQSVKTLHVYTDTIQIPVLVLSPQHETVLPIAPDRFNISIDGGPKFRAKHVRLEGDDPVSLSILFDVSGDESALMSKVSGAIAGLAPLSLRPQDRVSIYALDCALVRSLNDVPAEPTRLQVGVNAALETWINRVKAGRKSTCKQKIHLWDALAVVIRHMSQSRGRRVILAMTSGVDQGSVNNWNRVRLFAEESGVAIFGLRAGYDVFVPNAFQRLDVENALSSLCELTGGLIFSATPKTVTKELEWFTEIVRGRYIVEFPRPLHGAIGPHDLLVSVDKSNAFVRSAGVSVPIVDPATLADPTTVLPDPSLTPEVGKHRVITPH
ncbi:hypothetical protein [Tunturiibacter lichenicola]|uniref:hypothetical protein n=1 Tax=Tunturiibacter lichenicola TaxID=2051959 RepID=UPI003D9ADE63